MAASAKRSISSWASSNEAPGRNRPSRVPTRKTCVSTGTSRQPVGEQEDAGRRLAADARAARRGSRAPPRRGAVSSQRRSSPSRARRIFWMTFDFVGARPPGRIASSTSSEGRRARPSQSGSARAAAVGDVAVAVVRVLRQDREDQLVDRRAVRLRAGLPVRRAQALHDRAHAAAVGPFQSLRLRSCTPWHIIEQRAEVAGIETLLAPGRRRADPLRPRQPEQLGLGCRSSSARAASRLDLPGFGRSAKPATSTTRSRATATGSTRSPPPRAGALPHASCTTGAPSRACSARSGSSGS